MDNETKIEALAQFLSIDLDEVEEEYENVFSADGGEYMVLSDEHAHEVAADYIKESLWAVNKSFLDGYSEAIHSIPDEQWQGMASELCEGFNTAVRAMLGDSLDEMIEDAIGSDGLGHFIGFYDGETLELPGDLLAFRVN